MKKAIFELGIDFWRTCKMGKEVDVLLDTNDRFPELELQLVSGESIKLPEATGEGYGIVLFYRGSW